MSFGDLFLQNPELFPARAAGEPWGEGSVAVDFAGGPYVFSGLDADREAVARRRFEGFCLPPGAASPAAVGCRVLRATEGEFRTFDLRAWELTLDLDATPDCVRVAGLGLMARLDWRPSLQAALWTAAAHDTFAGVLENVFRVLVSYRLVETGGALLHSAGIVEEGRVWLFVGPSGAGKSTLARTSLAEGRSVLSDDLNAVAPGEDGWVVAPVPFAGDHRGSLTQAFPLAALCQLRQGKATRLEALSPAGAVATMLAAAPFANQDPHRIERLLANLEALAAAGPAHRATIALEAGVWSSLRRERAVA